MEPFYREFSPLIPLYEQSFIMEPIQFVIFPPMFNGKSVICNFLTAREKELVHTSLTSV